MAVKEFINRNRGVFTVVALIAVGVAVWTSMRSLRGGPNFGAETAYYSDDDGKTWFKDSASLITPFEQSGKQVCRAHVFRCKGKEFVGYLEKSNEKPVPAGSVAPAADKPADGKQTPVIAGPGFVKKPGTTEWVPRGNFRLAAGVMDVKCEGVAPTDVEYVMP